MTDKMIRHTDDFLTDKNDLIEDLHDTKYFSPETFEKEVKFLNSLSIFHLNIRNLSKNRKFKTVIIKFFP